MFLQLLVTYIFMQSQMPRQFHLGPIRKNAERKQQLSAKKRVGRPKKTNVVCTLIFINICIS